MQRSEQFGQGQVADHLIGWQVPEPPRFEVLGWELEVDQVDCRLVGGEDPLVTGDRLGHGHPAVAELDSGGIPSVGLPFDEDLGLDPGAGVPVAVETAGDRPAGTEVELRDLPVRAQVHVDRAGMERGEGSAGLDLADYLARVPIDDQNRVGRARPERYPRCDEPRPPWNQSFPGLPEDALPDQVVRRLRRTLPEPPPLVRPEGQFVGGRGQVASCDLGGGMVEDRRLDRSVEELIRVATEVLVEPVRPGHVDRQATAFPAGPAPHLPEAGDRPGEVDADRRVEVAHVYPQLERVGCGDPEQLAGREAGLDVPPLGRGVAGAVRCDPLGQVGPALRHEPLGGELADQFDAPAALHEADRPYLEGDEVGQQVGGLGDRRTPCARCLVDQRWVPDHDLPFGGGRPTFGYLAEVLSDQPLGEFDRIGDRRRGEQEAGCRTVCCADPPEPPDHVRDVRAEDAAVGVGLVDHHPVEPFEEVPPRLVVGQDPDVEHVGVGHHQVRFPADRGPAVPWGIPVVDRVAEAGGIQLGESPGLVLGEGLGRVEVERCRPTGPGQAVEHRQVEGEGFPRGGRGGDDQVRLTGLAPGLHLMGVERSDPGPLECLGDPGIQFVGDRLGDRVQSRLDPRALDPPVTPGRVDRDGPWGAEQRAIEFVQLRSDPAGGSLRTSSEILSPGETSTSPSSASRTRR